MYIELRSPFCCSSEKWNTVGQVTDGPFKLEIIGVMKLSGCH